MASYQNGDLTGIHLGGNDLSGGAFAGKNLTDASFDGATLAEAHTRASDDPLQPILTKLGFQEVEQAVELRKSAVS